MKIITLLYRLAFLLFIPAVFSTSSYEVVQPSDIDDQIEGILNDSRYTANTPTNTSQNEYISITVDSSDDSDHDEKETPKNQATNYVARPGNIPLRIQDSYYDDNTAERFKNVDKKFNAKDCIQHCSMKFRHKYKPPADPEQCEQAIVKGLNKRNIELPDVIIKLLVKFATDDRYLEDVQLNEKKFCDSDCCVTMNPHRGGFGCYDNDGRSYDTNCNPRTTSSPIIPIVATVASIGATVPFASLCFPAIHLPCTQIAVPILGRLLGLAVTFSGCPCDLCLPRRYSDKHCCPTSSLGYQSRNKNIRCLFGTEELERCGTVHFSTALGVYIDYLQMCTCSPAQVAKISALNCAVECLYCLSINCCDHIEWERTWCDYCDEHCSEMDAENVESVDLIVNE
eukprot:71038_1